MPRTRNKTLHDQRHKEILSAAARVFKAKGFHLARTEDICSEAKLSAGTVFRHFPDKRAMIQAIAAIEFERYKREVNRLATKEGLQWLGRITPQEIEDLLKPTAFDLGSDSWLELARDVEGKKRLLAFDKKLRGALMHELARGQAKGWVRKTLDTRGAANVILAVFSGLAFDHEIGAVIEPSATATAIADLFQTFILS
jgi:AcrR family transcriptional regulator